jgi:hypothetical protein
VLRCWGGVYVFSSCLFVLCHEDVGEGERERGSWVLGEGLKTVIDAV